MATAKKSRRTPTRTMINAVCRVANGPYRDVAIVLAGFSERLAEAFVEVRALRAEQDRLRARMTNMVGLDELIVEKVGHVVATVGRLQAMPNPTPSARRHGARRTT